LEVNPVLTRAITVALACGALLSLSVHAQPVGVMRPATKVIEGPVDRPSPTKGASSKAGSDYSPTRTGKEPGRLLNPVQRENARSDGVTSAWRITGDTMAFHDEIGGYAGATSVNRGSTIDLFVRVNDLARDPTYTIDVYRMGYYGGVGARLVMPRITQTSVAQPACGVVDTATRLVECDWTNPYRLQIPTSATDPTVAMSGVYLAKLTTARGKSAFVPFVVRDDARPASFLFQSSFTTYQAYNYFGQYSYYAWPDGDTNRRPSYKVSFNRPYDVRSGFGAGQFLFWEYHAVRFLEREGYDTVYSTNLDTHNNPARLLGVRAFISAGHDEYWTREMYDAKEAARNNRVNLAFLGANTGYWQVRLEPDAAGRSQRRMVGYRYWVTEWINDVPVNHDPMAGTPAATTLWRNLGRAETSLVGVGYDFDPIDGDVHMVACPRWMCRGTSVGPGSVLPGMLGYEVDQVGPDTPPGTLVLARSPYTARGEQRMANMTFYTHASGASVFASGSMQWNWGLDSYVSEWLTTPSRVNVDVQTMTRNILDRFLTLPVRVN
jgi:hypothetical protein